MLLNVLYEIVNLGSEKPLILWLEKFRKLGPELAIQLEQISSRLNEKTNIKKEVDVLVKLLKEKNPNELDLAKSFSHIADLFRKNVPIEHQDLINSYIRAVMKFINLAQMGEFSHQIRVKLLGTLSETEQKEHDKRLFEHEGMIYCLEYNLAMFKAIQDAPNKIEVCKYFRNKEVNLGFGNVPGLCIDFSHDEVLNKFIYIILDNDVRQHLIKTYFDVKSIILKVEVSCDKKEKCETTCSSVTLEEAEVAFRKMILELLKTFQLIGVENLGSFFFKPYGDKPLINEVIKQI